LFIVADGMGGHQYGEVASSTAVRTLAGHILNQIQPFLVNPATIMEESIREVMHSAINEAQRAVTQTAPGSGTTLTAALVFGQNVTIGHVGDSRAYVIHPNGSGEALTHDHSLVKRLEELGQISSEEAATHPRRNVLYRALGQGEILEPDIFTAPLPRTDSLLLCSDGLWGVLPADRLFQLVSSAQDPLHACQSLVAAANEAGGPDNISVIIVKPTA
jgi:serine/threonine protein phosphatase PrpC